MSKIKHNKIKNTGILFESLIRQITADILEDKQQSVSIQIIKEFFKKNTELRKELKLYNSLIDAKFNNDIKASSYVDAVVDSRKTLNGAKLKREKYEIIKRLKENFDIEKLFSSKIDNYPVYASIYKLFEYSTNLHEITNPSDLINSKFTIVNHLLRKNIKENTSNLVSEILTKEPMPVRMLTQKIIIDEFNKEFSDKLLPSQKSLIKEYINCVSNINPINEYVNKRIDKINNKINIILKKIPDEAIKIKIQEISKSLNKVKSIKHIKDNHILAILKTYSLLHEIEKHIKENKCGNKNE